MDIDCPGDSVTYNCSIVSNTEYLHLIWTVIFPDEMPVTVIYDGLSLVGNVNNLDYNITSTLITIREEYIESIIKINLLSNVSQDNSLIECSIEDLANESMILNLEQSG